MEGGRCFQCFKVPWRETLQVSVFSQDQLTPLDQLPDLKDLSLNLSLFFQLKKNNATWPPVPSRRGVVMFGPAEYI